MSENEELDTEKIDNAVLALLWYGAFKQRKQDTHYRTWKGFAFDVMDRLHEQGYITDPENKYKSVLLTDEGEQLSQELFAKLFKKDK